MTTHSDKALTTLKLMDTLAADWKGADYIYTEEMRQVMGDVKCSTCQGHRWVLPMGDGTYKTEPETSEFPSKAGAYDYMAWEQAHREFQAQVRAAGGRGFYGNCPGCRNRKGYCTGTMRGLVMRKMMVGRPVIPAGTVFDSRFGSGCSCALCNKTVLKSNLWCVIATGANGVKHAMYIGEDCMKKFLPGAAFYPKYDNGKKIARDDIYLEEAV